MRVMDHTNYQNYQNIYRQDSRSVHGNDSQTVSTEAQAARKEETLADAKTARGNENLTGSKAIREDENLTDSNAAGTGAGNASALPVNANSKQTGDTDSLLERMRQRTNAAQKAFSASGSTTLYSSTPDLMAIANTESQEILRGIYVRLSFKLWAVRAKGATGTDSKAIKSATRSIQKVMGKVKGKIKGLQKEDEMEKKAEVARKAKQRRLQQEIRRELAIKRKIRKNKERKDIEDSYLESDGQYSLKGYLDRLPDDVLMEMEMRASGTSGTAAVDAGVSVDAAIAAAGMDASMGVDAAAAVAEVSGAVVDLAL